MPDDFLDYTGPSGTKKLRSSRNGDLHDQYVVLADLPALVAAIQAIDDSIATQATLAAVLAELGQKLEPGDLAALATAAKQDALKTVVDAIAASVDGLEGFTDGLEGALAALNGKDFATQATLAALSAIVSSHFATAQVTESIRISTAGDNLIVDPAVGKAVRLHWIAMFTPQSNAAETLAVVKVGTKTPYRVPMGNPMGFQHRQVVEGNVDGDFVINLSAAQPVDVSYTIQEV